MTQQDRDKRRAQIVRRWAAYRSAEAQREIWRKRRADMGLDDEPGDSVPDDVLLADLPDDLVG